MKILLLLSCIALVAAESTLAVDRIAQTARDDVVAEVWRERVNGEARAILISRRDLPVAVTFAVGATPLSLVEYEQRLEAGQAIAFATAPVVAAGTAIRPELRIIRVAPLPIEEASGYVRICEDNQASGISIIIFRPVTGGNRAYAVLTNATDRAVTVEWQTLGFVDAGHVVEGDAGVLLDVDLGAALADAHEAAQPLPVGEAAHHEVPQAEEHRRRRHPRQQVAHEGAAGQIKFEDGSVLYHHADGTCRMFDTRGRKMEMKDSVEMKAADGRRFLLMNKKVWVQTGKPGAGSPTLRNKCQLTQIVGRQ